MDYAVVISAIVLGLSVLATIAKFLDWFVHSDPKTMVRTSRWMLLLLVLACVPLLIVMIANQQWPAAMLIGAGMLIVPTLLKWRAMFAPLRAAFDYFRPKPRPFDMEIWDTDAADDPEMVRRAAAILEAYLGKSSLVALGDGRRSARDDRARDEGERGLNAETRHRIVGHHEVPGLVLERRVHRVRGVDALEGQIVAAPLQFAHQEGGVPLVVFDDQ